MALLGPQAALASEMHIVGTGDGLDVLRSIAMAYSASSPQMRVLVPPDIGSAGAVLAVGADREVMGRITRPLLPSEQALGLRYEPLARLPVVFITHPDLEIPALTSRQLADIFAGRIINWKAFGGPDLKIRVVRREDQNAIGEALRSALAGWDHLVMTERSKLATNAQDAVATVRDHPGAISYSPYSATFGTSVRILSVDGVSPRENNYQPAITLALIFKPERLGRDERQFVAFAMSERAAQIAARFGAQAVRP